MYSNTLEAAPWGDSSCTVVKGDAAGEVARLKEQPGRNIFLVGSITLAQSLMRAGLVDEYHINLNPVVLGGGRALFPGGLEKALNLQLVSSTPLPTGRHSPALRTRLTSTPIERTAPVAMSFPLHRHGEGWG